MRMLFGSLCFGLALGGVIPVGVAKAQTAGVGNSFADLCRNPDQPFNISTGSNPDIDRRQIFDEAMVSGSTRDEALRRVGAYNRVNQRPQELEFECGFAYETGSTVPVELRDPKGVNRWVPANQLDEAIEAGGKVLTDGQPYQRKLVFRNYFEAVRWYEKSAQHGNVNAQDHLARLYANGYGVPLDKVRAAFWLRKAAEQGDDWAQNNLGYVYQEGSGVTKNTNEAMMWYEKASASGNYEAQNRLVALRQSVHEERIRLVRTACIAVGIIICAGLLVWLMIWAIRNRSRLIPRNTRAKQSAILFPVAMWCSACCLYPVFNPTLMHHPINAAVTAILLSMPALIWGTLALWWLSDSTVRRSKDQSQNE